MLLGLDDKRVLVTGSSRGIGLAIARSFLEEEAHVAISSRDEKDLIKIKKDFLNTPFYKKLLLKAADYRKQEDILAVKNYLYQKWGGLDILVANVGSGESTGGMIPNQRDFENVMRENFNSTVDTVRQLYPLIKKSGGVILLIASIAGIEAFGAPIDYSVAKTAVISFCKNLARKAAMDGVRINCLAPGNILFPGGSWEKKISANSKMVRAMIKSNVPLGRFGKPEEVADAAIFICSQRATFITGSCLIIDGGQTVAVF